MRREKEIKNNDLRRERILNPTLRSSSLLSSSFSSLLFLNAFARHAGGRRVFLSRRKITHWPLRGARLTPLPCLLFTLGLFVPPCAVLFFYSPRSFSIERGRTSSLARLLYLSSPSLSPFPPVQKEKRRRKKFQRSFIFRRSFIAHSCPLSSPPPSPMSPLPAPIKSK